MMYRTQKPIYATPTTSALRSAARDGAEIARGSLADRLARAYGGPQAAIDAIAEANESVKRPPTQVALPSVPDAWLHVKRSGILLSLPDSARDAEREAALQVASELNLAPSDGTSWTRIAEGLVVLRLKIA